MCNQGIGCLRRSSSLSDNLFDQQQHQVVYRMDTPAAAPVPAVTPGSNDESPRVKFLCSFGGCILPRPQDGKLRYVGGETRIVSLPRYITYDELMVRVRELFEGAALLKYQQPDEDLDALVSVVNDDDVTNMMEEYDKLGSGDGFTRLRIFLFSYPEQDVSSHFDTDERETEWRYVDALNSLNEAPESRNQQPPESPVMAPVENIHVVDQFFNPMNLEAGFHNQRNCEMPWPQFNLHHLKIPHPGSGQHQQSHTRRYNEMEAPWSPAYYSPRHHGNHDPRPVAEFPTSPSSGRYHIPFGELSDKCFDRMSEEHGRQQVNPQLPYDHPPPFVDNVVWLPPGAIPGEKAGFPGNLSHALNVYEGNSICENCQMTFQRNQTMSEAARYPDMRWQQGGQPHLEQPNKGNEFHPLTYACAECGPSRETYIMNPDVKLDNGMYSKEQNEPRTFYNEAHNHERGRILHHQLNHRGEEPRGQISGAGRMNEHNVVEATDMNFPLGHGKFCDGHQMPSNYINHEDSRYIRSGSEFGNEGFHDQAVGAGPHIHFSALENRGVRYGNLPSAYGTDNHYQVSHAPAAAHALWRKVQSPMHCAPSYEASSIPAQANGTTHSGILRGTQDGSPRLYIGMDNQNPWAGSSQKMGFDGSAAPEYIHGHALKLNSNTLGQESQQSLPPGHIRSPPDMLDFATPPKPVLPQYSSSSMINDKMVASTTLSYNPGLKNMVGEGYKAKHVEPVEDSNMQSISYPEKLEEADKKYDEAYLDSNCLRLAEEGGDIVKLGENDVHATFEDEEFSIKRLSFLPELIASVKKAALECGEEVKARAQGNVDGDLLHDTTTKEADHELESMNANTDLEVDSDIDHLNIAIIEPTKAEAEAVSRGLQTIKNDDLEEIRELGSGTYGSVYHGKWKGSDVAIKRIKASCFAGRPSERDRLIADFWKEALILSSLHHPNVVSFYGIVRDGPDGSLATLTEFMVNGSLKQFLQKKDRTIDRRKRLILAMDAAFGMEYLHGKNIVHFDLKCENLLVNMRDPHRPVCKIGDLGLSKVKHHTLVSGGVRGTLPWMAPELLSGKSNMVTEKIDVYSFGIVMWELLTGDEPYADMHCASIIGGIVNNSLRPQVPTWCDPEWKSLMESCWASDPGERPSFSEISQKLRKMSAAINVK